MISTERSIAGLWGVGLLACGAVGCAAPTAAGVEVPDLSGLMGVVRWGGVLLSLLVLGAAIVAVRLLRESAKRLGTKHVSRRPLLQRIESLARFGVFLATGVLCVGLSFRVDHQLFLFMGAGVALAIGFALRDLVAALVAGATILLTRPFQVGDRVRHGDTHGVVLHIGLHSVRLRTLDETVVTVPNHKILAEKTETGTDGALDMPVPMEFFIGLDQDAELAVRLVTESMLTSRYAFLDQPVSTSLSQVLLPNGYAALRIAGRAYVHDARFERDFITDVTKRVLRAFRKHGILSPAILHRVVLDGHDDRGSSH